ncbi:MAG: single-stranded DNA-binding protein [Candidatus Margulisiibacteriota bacterium]
MTSINRIVLTGRLTHDPETRTVGKDLQIATFSLAVDRFKKKGEKEVSFVKCVAWRGTAKLCSMYLKKGRLVAVEGRLQVRKFETKEGQNRTAAEVVVSNIQLLDSRFFSAAGKVAADEPAAAETAELEPDEEIVLV